LRNTKSLQHKVIGVRTIADYPAREIDVKEYATLPAMISKCSNPNCSKLLMRMDGGRFFGFPTANKTVEHFWLCSNCAKNFTLRQIEGRVELLQRERKIA